MRPFPFSFIRKMWAFIWYQNLWKFEKNWSDWTKLFNIFFSVSQKYLLVVEICFINIMKKLWPSTVEYCCYIKISVKFAVIPFQMTKNTIGLNTGHTVICLRLFSAHKVTFAFITGCLDIVWSPLICGYDLHWIWVIYIHWISQCVGNAV